MGPVGVGRRDVKEGGYGLTTVPPALPYPTPPKPGTQLQAGGAACVGWSPEAINHAMYPSIT